MAEGRAVVQSYVDAASAVSTAEDHTGAAMLRWPYGGRIYGGSGPYGGGSYGRSRAGIRSCGAADRTLAMVRRRTHEFIWSEFFFVEG